MIAVMAQKLQLSKSEEYVHNFITDNKLKKKVGLNLIIREVVGENISD